MAMKNSNTKDLIIENAYAIILDRGYPAATVDEICRVTKVSKGSFFHYFKTKEALGLEVLDWYYKKAIQLIGNGKYALEADPVKRIYLFLDHLNAVSYELWSKGCLLGSFASYLAAAGKPIAERVSKLFDGLVQNLSLLFEPVLVKLKNYKGPSAPELAEQLLQIIEGSIVMARAYDDWKHVPKAIENFRKYLQLLIH
jgi:TetR/AcrR family transcriptional repressor of nem operon